MTTKYQLAEALRELIALDDTQYPGPPTYKLQNAWEAARTALAAYDAAQSAPTKDAGAVPVAWVGPVGQLMPHLIYEAWSKAYPDDAAHFSPLYAHPPTPSPAVERDERAETWKALYRKAVNCANGLTNYVEDRPELRRIERELTAIESAARAALEGEKPV